MKNPIRFYIAHFICWTAFHLAFSIKVVGKENIPQDSNFICATNHRTYADPPLVGICLRKRFCYIAKKQLFKNPAFSWLIRKLGAIPSTSDDPEYDIISVASDIMQKENKPICIFPEGTRSKTGKIGRGHLGVVVMAAKTGVPVLPCAIVFGKKLHFRSKIVFKIGKPLYLEKFGCDENSSARQLKPMLDEIMHQITDMAEN